MPDTNPNTDINLQEVSTRNEQARHIVAGFSPHQQFVRIALRLRLRYGSPRLRRGYDHRSPLLCLPIPQSCLNKPNGSAQIRMSVEYLSTSGKCQQIFIGQHFTYSPTLRVRETETRRWVRQTLP